MCALQTDRRASRSAAASTVDVCHVCIVEDHNEALDHIYREIGAKRLAFEQLTLVHFDSHPDLGLPSGLAADDVRKRDTLIVNLSIENWILPMVFAGHVATVFWIKPTWSTQLDVGRYDMVVGKDTRDGRVRCSCRASYFLSDRIYAPEIRLTDKRTLCLHVCDLEQLLRLDDNDDSASELRRILMRRHERSVILDIDLDFFSTRDPFRMMFSTADNYEIFKSVYRFEADLVTDITDDQFDAKYERYSANKSARLSTIRRLLGNHIGSIARASHEAAAAADAYLGGLEGDALRNLEQLAHEIGARQLDLEILHEYGSALDERPLPDHVSSVSQIETMITQFSSFLSQYFVDNLTPSLVTIARSSLDDYCPTHQVDLIQTQVVDKIQQFFENKSRKIGSIRLDY